MTLKTMLSLAVLLVAGVQDDDAKAKQEKLDIRPQGEWKAEKQDVQRVLDWCAAELWIYFPDRKLKPLLVEATGGPITLFKRGDDGEIRIRLNTGGTLWAQYTFQFAHELAHVLCSFDDDLHVNKWFEETLCEVASLFVLRRSAETWKTKPPYKHWKDYAKSLKSYAQDRIDESPLPKGQTLAKWYEDNATQLRKNATDRAKNNIAAVRLLPLFEKEPEHWEAVTWLNEEKLDKTYDLKKYLDAWQKNAPGKHRAFIRKIAKKFGVTLKKR